jgi:hypothetical protein
MPGESFYPAYRSAPFASLAGHLSRFSHIRPPARQGEHLIWDNFSNGQKCHISRPKPDRTDAMRYHFDFNDGVETFHDAEGHELADHLAAYRHATTFLVEAATDLLPRTVGDRRIEVSAREATGIAILKMSILFEARFLAKDQLN